MSERVWSQYDELWEETSSLRRQVADLERRLLDLEIAERQRLIADAMREYEELSELADPDGRAA